MPKPIWGLQAALQARHTWLSLLTEKHAKEWERSGLLSKQALHHYFCLGGKKKRCQQNSLRVRAGFAGTGRQQCGSAPRGAIRKVMQYTINLSYKVSKLSLCPGNEYAPPAKDDAGQKKAGDGNTLTLKPSGILVVCGDCKYSGLLRELLAQVRLRKTSSGTKLRSREEETGLTWSSILGIPLSLGISGK